MRRHLHFPEFLDARLRQLMKQHAHTRWKVPPFVSAPSHYAFRLTLSQTLVQDMSESLRHSGR